MLHSNVIKVHEFSFTFRHVLKTMENIRRCNENVNFLESTSFRDWKNPSVKSLFKTTAEERINWVRWTEKKVGKNVLWRRQLEGNNAISLPGLKRDDFPYITWLVIGIFPNVNLNYDVAEEGAINATLIFAQERQRKKWLQPKCYQSSDWTAAQM